MIKIDLINSELFESLLEISYNKLYYDIHNDFDIKSIKYNQLTNDLVFIFSEIKGQTILHFLFSDVSIIDFDIPIHIKNLTIDNFHRGRFEYNGNLLDEYDNKKCFYIEFYEEGKFDFLCSKAILKIIKEGKLLNFNSNYSKH